MNMIPPTQLTELLVASPSTAVNSEFSFTKINKQTVDAIVELKSPDKALIITRVKTAARLAMVADNGMIVYDLDLNRYYFYQQGGWVKMDVGDGDVVGPDVSVASNIAVFADTTGKLLKDSGVEIDRVPLPPSYLAERKARNMDLGPLEDVNEIREIGNIAFVERGVIFIDNTYQIMTFNKESLQQSVVVTDGGSVLPTSFDALFEIKSNAQTMLFSTLSTDAFSAIASPAPGMFAFNTDTENFWGYTSTDAGFGPISLPFIENSANDNLFIGAGAGNYTVSGEDNLGTGINVFSNLTTGMSNTVYGQNAAVLLDIGIQNCYFGNGCAGAASHDVQENSGFGFNALNVVGDSQNSAFGAHCFENVLDGTTNCGFGYKAGFSLGYGHGNVFFGANSANGMLGGYDNVVIGNSACGAVANPLNFLVVIGVDAGSALQTGSDGTILIGAEAGALLTSAVGTVGVGTSVLANATSATQCTAFGVGSMSNASSIMNCSGFGYNTLNVSSDSSNSAFGSNCFAFLDSGSSNLGAGAFAGYGFTSGSDCVFLGYNTGRLIGATSECVFVGSSAGVSAVGAVGTVGVGYLSASSNHAAALTAIGTAALQQNITGPNCTAAGYNALNASNSAGNSAFGAFAAKNLSDPSAASNCFFGYNSARAMTSGVSNVIAGALTASNYTSINDSVILGYNSCNSSGDVSSVVVIGTAAAGFLTSACGGTVSIGNAAHQALALGTMNTTIGHQSSPALYNGSGNTIGGYQSFTLCNQGNNNSGWGCQVLQADCLDNNTAFGFQSLFATTQYQNTGLGALSGSGYAGHSMCTYLGFAADGNANVLVNSTAVGANAIFSKSNNITLGDSSVSTSVSIGLNGAADGEILHILGEMAIQGYAESNTDAAQSFTHKGQYYEDTSNTTSRFTFPLDLTLAGASQVCKVEIGVTSITSAGFGNSITAMSWDGATSGAVGGVFPSIVIVTSGAATFTAAWAIVSNNLVLNIFSDVHAHWTVNYEYFSAVWQA